MNDPRDYRGGFRPTMAAHDKLSLGNTIHPALPQELSDCAIFGLCFCLGTKSECEATSMYPLVSARYSPRTEIPALARLSAMACNLFYMTKSDKTGL